jgi:RNA-binding protein Luc7-like 2
MGIVPVDIKFTDPKVCRNFLAGICPHDVFVNTKMDLGQCPKTHSQRLKDEYEAALAAAANDPADTTYSIGELNAIKAENERNVQAFVNDCDRKIFSAQRRLEKTPEENNKTTALVSGYTIITCLSSPQRTDIPCS